MPEKKEEQKKLNPQITETEIGVRSLRKITIYPLSMADQLKMTDLITEGMNAFFIRKEEQSDMAFVQYLVGMVKDNIGRILTMATDEKNGKKLLEELTNAQAARIAEIIYDVNYDVIAKNFKSLFDKVKILFPSERPLPLSASDTQDTGLTTSTEEAGETEESPSDS